MKLGSRLGAEFLGTYVLVLGGTGAAVFAAAFIKGGENTGLGIGFTGVSLAFGLTVLCMAYAVGHISGGHFNPAITLGLAAARKFEWKDAIPYIVTQVVAAIAASATVFLIIINKAGQTKDSVMDAGALAANGYGSHSPGLYRLGAGLVAEVVLTAIFLIVILGVTDKRASKGFAALAIGLSLTLIHLISIPITNTSVNPARSTGPAVMSGLAGESWPLEQLWLFWLAPVVGGVIGALIYVFVAGDDTVSDASVAGAD
jgi:aquaporin Z